MPIYSNRVTLLSIHFNTIENNVPRYPPGLETLECVAGSQIKHAVLLVTLAVVSMIQITSGRLSATAQVQLVAAVEEQELSLYLELIQAVASDKEL
jgi:hypothetical protein